MIRRVAVIGAGTAGRSFAQRCALAGFAVTLEDVMPAKLRRAQDDFGDLPVRYALTVEDAVRDADLAVDFVPDELESKLEIFSLLDRMAPPRTILLTPTVALSVTDLASCTYRASLCVGVKAAGVDVLMSPVILLRSRFVGEAALEDVRGLFEALGVGVGVEEDVVDPQLVRNLLEL